MRVKGLLKDALQKGVEWGALGSLFCGVYLGSLKLDYLASAFILLFILGGVTLRRMELATSGV